MTDVCYNCGEEFVSIGIHWANSSTCDYLQPTEKQMDILIGLVMGDGTISTSKNSNVALRANMITEEYLKYLDSKFPVLGAGVKLYRTAKESAECARDSGFSSGAKAENYSDIYTWRTLNNPHFNVFEDWYSSGSKVWPADVTLTPTVLKHLYVCDGYFRQDRGKGYIKISMSNEIDNKEKINSMFHNVNLPEPSRWNSKDAIWRVEESYEIFDYIGGPLPGFSYKWPEP